jgi:hypothetical protein
MKLTPDANSLAADRGSLVSESRRLRDHDASQRVVTEMVDDPPFGVLDHSHVDLARP